MWLKKSILVSILILSSPLALAGNNTNPSPETSETKSYTLEDIYKRLDTGKEDNQTTFTGSEPGPEQPVGHTLNEIMEKVPMVTSDAAKPDDVAKGKKYWGLAAGNWGLKTGTGMRDGVECSMGGNRFTDNGNGTVTDNCTQLIWLKNANCFYVKIWQEAMNAAKQLAAGQCDLKDVSSAGDWRLPSIKELQSLIDYSKVSPALPKIHPFLEMRPDLYWSSTEGAYDEIYAWYVSFNNGHVNTSYKSSTYYVWPVRSRQ
jgi:hypothetical protein